MGDGMKWLLIVCMIGVTAELSAFDTLADVRAYVATVPELVEPDNKDDFNPKFQRFFKENKIHWWEKPLLFFGIARSLAFSSVKEVKKLFSALVDEREALGMKGRMVMKFDAKPGDQLVVWGDIQGSFHSFVRTLSELEKMGIIDNNLHIKDAHYFIFNANVIGQTAYNLELLTLVALIMYRNPHKVFFIRGKNEDDIWGYKHNVLRHLDMVGEEDKRDPASLFSIMSRFINTLPFALYLNYHEGKEIFRISGYGRELVDLDEQLMGNFFSKNGPSMYHIDKIKGTDDDIHVRVLLKSVDGLSDFPPTEGLSVLEPAGGAVAWAVFSGPNRLQGSTNGVFDDAFALITLGKELHDATIAIYTHDRRQEKDPFVLHKKYLLYDLDDITKAPPGAHMRRKSIVVGSTIDLSKRLAAEGRSIRRGMLARVDEINQAGGIHDRKLKIIVLDDGYNPADARANVEYLMHKQKIDIFLMSVGGPTLEASRDLLQRDEILMLFPLTGILEFRTPDIPGIINFRPSYKDEVYGLMHYLLDKQALKKFVFFYQDDIYGRGALSVAKHILQERGITEWVEIPYNRQTTDFKEVTEKIRKAQPDALGLFSVSAPTAEMLRQIGIGPLVGTKLFGLSFLGDTTFQTFADDYGFDYVFAHVVPDPQSSDLPLVKEYRAAMDERKYRYGIFSLEAYIGTSLLAEAFKKIHSKKRQEVKAFFEGLKDFNYKGLTLSFDPQSRGLSRDIWLDVGEHKPWIKMTDPVAIYYEAQKQREKVAQEKAREHEKALITYEEPAGTLL